MKPWQPGQSGNPGGRPRKKLISAELERLLQEEAPAANGKTWAAVIAEMLLKQAVQGNIRAISEVANRIEGTPRQAVDLAVSQSEDVEMMSDADLEQRIAELWEKLQKEMRER